MHLRLKLQRPALRESADGHVTGEYQWDVSGSDVAWLPCHCPSCRMTRIKMEVVMNKLRGK
jgi:hypothetical protein